MIGSVAVHLFFNPDLVGQLAACGITARRSPPIAPTSGFVVEGRSGALRERQTVTNVIAVHAGVTVTGPRQGVNDAAATRLAAAPPQTALELVTECDRLRRDNNRLTTERDQLRAELDRLKRPVVPCASSGVVDDTAARFALLELD